MRRAQHNGANEYLLLRALIKEVSQEKLENLDEGFLDALKAFVADLLGTSKESFQSADVGEKVSLQIPPEREKTGQKFNPVENPEDQLYAMDSMLKTVNSSLNPNPRISDIIENAGKLIKELESFADGSHPKLIQAKNDADKLFRTAKDENERKKKIEEFVEKIGKLYEESARRLYEYLVKDVSESYGYFAGSLKNVEFSNESWYKKIMEIGTSAQPAGTATKTVEAWAASVKKIEDLKLADTAQKIVDSDPVQNLLKDEVKVKFIKNRIDFVRTEIGRHNNLFPELKRQLDALYPVIKKIDELMDKSSKTVEKTIKTAEEKAGTGEEQKAVSTPLMSHYLRRNSQVLQEGFRNGLRRSADEHVLRTIIREVLYSTPKTRRRPSVHRSMII